MKVTEIYIIIINIMILNFNNNEILKKNKNRNLKKNVDLASAAGISRPTTEYRRPNKIQFQAINSYSGILIKEHTSVTLW